MGRKVLDLTGMKFGRLTVTKLLDYRRNGFLVVWLCECECGNYISVSAGSLKNSGTRSCGCLRRRSCELNTERDKEIYNRSLTESKASLGRFYELSRERIRQIVEKQEKLNNNN